MATIIGLKSEELRRDKRRKIDRLRYVLANQLVEVKDIGLGGFLASHQIKNLRPNDEVSIKQGLCDRNIVKKIQCPFDKTNKKMRVQVDLDINVRLVRNNDDGTAAFRFVRLTSDRYNKIAACVCCGLNADGIEKKGSILQRVLGFFSLSSQT